MIFHCLGVPDLVFGHGGTRQVGELLSAGMHGLKNAWAACHSAKDFLKCSKNAGQALGKITSKAFDATVKAAQKCYGAGPLKCGAAVGKALGKVGKKAWEGLKKAPGAIVTGFTSYAKNIGKAFSVNDKAWQECKKMGRTACAVRREKERQMKLVAYNKGIKEYCGDKDVMHAKHKVRCGLVHVNKWFTQKVSPVSDWMYTHGISVVNAKEKLGKAYKTTKENLGKAYRNTKNAIGATVKFGKNAVGSTLKFGKKVFQYSPAYLAAKYGYRLGKKGGELARKGYQYTKQLAGRGLQYGKNIAGKGIQYGKQLAGRGLQYGKNIAGKGLEYGKKAVSFGAKALKYTPPYLAAKYGSKFGKKVAGNAVDFARTAGKKVSSAATSAVRTGTNAARKVWDWERKYNPVVRGGEYVARKTYSTVKNVGTKAVSTVKNIGSSAVSGAKKVFHGLFGKK